MLRLLFATFYGQRHLVRALHNIIINYLMPYKYGENVLISIELWSKVCTALTYKIFAVKIDKKKANTLTFVGTIVGRRSLS